MLRYLLTCFDIGYGNTAEVIFLLDCSVCIDIVGFYNVIQFIKDVVQGLDISPDRTRVGVIPYNEDAFSSFGITAFTNKSEVLEAICKYIWTYMKNPYYTIHCSTDFAYNLV